jgi:hypothetical protein
MTRKTTDLSEKFQTVIKLWLTEDFFSFEKNFYKPIVICTPLLLKSGAAPLHR